MVQAKVQLSLASFVHEVLIVPVPNVVGNCFHAQHQYTEMVKYV